MNEHVCRCRKCGKFPQNDRLDSRHFAVRFKGDVLLVEEVRINSVRAEKLVDEFYVGENGWAVVHSIPIHMCICRGEVCSEVILGKVEAGFRAPVFE